MKEVANIPDGKGTVKGFSKTSYINGRNPNLNRSVQRTCIDLSNSINNCQMNLSIKMLD